MARGKSGRIVLEIEPSIKRNLYLSLEKNQVTLKDWFVETAERYITLNLQTPLYRTEYVAEKNVDIYTTNKKGDSK